MLARVCTPAVLKNKSILSFLLYFYLLQVPYLLPTVYSFSLVASMGTPGVHSSVDGTWISHLWGLRLAR